ncbi:Atypical PilZ domain-containing protein, cyclic di-GMP receptor [Formivibrio citricus]|uniref:Atypical PilZ domain-containing protein, cyclic di-GMP receptor n=1 Tax=Formivibrio citricus TaxID=83765 RepID=A0A1I4X899_9NEIS|nr:PilZ domain-containing protein [Formivibrio citricus]SFN22104.1 Atypical PilZ domain-containing protein, cyclic di-GMP receptor [Formivibrio citricus]
MKPAPIEGVHFCAVLPLAWRAKSGLSNLEVSRYLAVLAEFEQSGDDETGAQTGINAKLDLALLWLARALASEMPPTCETVIGLEQLVWTSDTPLETGASGFVALNLSESLPFLLPLPAKIESCSEQGGAWQIVTRLQLADETVRDWWERTVFRRHRRAIQLERSARS